MQIEILHFSTGAARAKGITVIIDVFRAFSAQGYAFSKGVKQIYTIGDLALAYSLKEQNPGYLLVGERHGKKLAGFDFGNSPQELLQAELADKTLIHTSSAGTQGIMAAKGASEVLTGALTNAYATAKYIQSRRPEYVSLVCMGVQNQAPADEDNLCAEYIRACLSGQDFDQSAAINVMRRGTGSRFFDPLTQSFQPQEDFALCTQFDIFDFVMPVKWSDRGIPYTIRQDI